MTKVAVITGFSLSGKTTLTEKLKEKYEIPYIEIDKFDFKSIIRDHYKLEKWPDGLEEKLDYCLVNIVLLIRKFSNNGLIVESIIFRKRETRDYFHKHFEGNIRFFSTSDPNFNEWKERAEVKSRNNSREEFEKETWIGAKEDLIPLDADLDIALEQIAGFLNINLNMVP